MVVWYVVQTVAGHEYKVESYLNKRLNSSVYTPFIPLHEKILSGNGYYKKETKPLFSGYVFIESETSIAEVLQDIRQIGSLTGTYMKLLTNTVSEDERINLLRLYSRKNCVESSIGIIVGDRIIVKEGPLIGMESIIRKIDRHKRIAFIEVSIFGDLRMVKVALEITEKIL